MSKHEKIVKIDGQDIKLKSTAATLILYNEAYGRDLMQDAAAVLSAVMESGIMALAAVLVDEAHGVGKNSEPSEVLDEVKASLASGKVSLGDLFGVASGLSSIDPKMLRVFYDGLYIMAKQAHDSDLHAAGKFPDQFDWLDRFGTMSIYSVAPDVFELWMGNNETMVDAQKKTDKPPGPCRPL